MKERRKDGGKEENKEIGIKRKKERSRKEGRKERKERKKEGGVKS